MANKSIYSQKGISFSLLNYKNIESSREDANQMITVAILKRTL